MQFNIIYHNIIVIRSTTHPVDKLDGIPCCSSADKCWGWIRVGRVDPRGKGYWRGCGGDVARILDF